MPNVTIKINDVNDNDYEIEGQDIELSVEGVTTVVVKKDSTKTNGWDILASFVNVSAAIKETD